jgi:HSP20 family protein
MRHEIDRIFGDFFSQFGSDEPKLMSKVWMPAVDLSETEKEFLVRMDLPGVNKNDVQVSVEDHELMVSGERHEDKKTESENFVRIERHHGNFYRSLTLPTRADTDHVKADFRDHELTVHIPKMPETEPKKVKVS